MWRINGHEFKFMFGDNVKSLNGVHSFEVQQIYSRGGENKYSAYGHPWYLESQLEMDDKPYFKGKVVCVESSNLRYYTPGKIYELDGTGDFTDNTIIPWRDVRAHSVDELNRIFSKESNEKMLFSDDYARFIEYKGEPSEPETYFSGKVVCVASGRPWIPGLIHFTPGKVYTLDEKGHFYDNTDIPFRYVRVHNIDELNQKFSTDCRYFLGKDEYARFIEYKGE